MPKTSPFTPPDLITGPELAAGCRISVRTLYTWEKTGRIPAPIRLGRRRLWPADTIARLLAAGSEA